MVHTYSLNGYYIAVDGNSGAIHFLDKVAFDMLQGETQFPLLANIKDKLNERYAVAELEEVYHEIEQLHNDEMLFSKAENLEAAIREKPVNHALKALCLNVAHDCNLRCDYCFASEGDYQCGRTLMSTEVALKAVDYLLQESKGRRSIEIDFFGGEPLMNFDVVKEVVSYGRSLEKKMDKSFYFTITTNGTLLDDEKINYINQNMDNVVISIDGRKDIHDAVRHDQKGRGSYARILPLAQRLVAGRNGKSYFVRGTFTARNKDFSKDVMHLFDQGFSEVSVEPVVGAGRDFHFIEADVSEIMSEYDKLALLYLERIIEEPQLRFYHFNIDVFKGPCLYKRVTACGAGYEYLAVSPEGLLYPCHQFVGQDGFSVGDINNGIVNQSLCEYFEQTNILKKEACSECWAKLFCSGGCHANAFFSNGSILEPNEVACKLQRKRIECAIMIQAAKIDKGV
ncbi:MAG: thioether cross-link-forming SCIFF peptide maturase [Negativicutes bacterium]|nr:thioether cross-link-forming SCIFF peptide maturase [Anaerotignum sp.]NCB76227.1 thioether cross-link-forming SCIFF peptide maturase [Negativicutes bacterium]